MPSIKKRVTGFIRQFSAPSGTSSERNDKHQARGGGKKNNLCPKSTTLQSPTPTTHNNLPPECFIQKYLNGYVIMSILDYQHDVV